MGSVEEKVPASGSEVGEKGGCCCCCDGENGGDGKGTAAGGESSWPSSSGSAGPWSVGADAATTATAKLCWAQATASQAALPGLARLAGLASMPVSFLLSASDILLDQVAAHFEVSVAWWWFD